MLLLCKALVSSSDALVTSSFLVLLANLVTTSKALVSSSDALVSTSFLLLLLFGQLRQRFFLLSTI